MIFLDLPFADMDAEEAACWIASRSDGAPFGYVVTPNSDHLVRLAREASLQPIYRNALLCVLDSRVVHGLAAIVGLRRPRVAPGSDITALLLDQHLRPGERITIVGLSPKWMPALIKRCGLAPPAHHNPPMGFDRDPAAFREAVDFVRANPARFIFLAVGTPRQEYLAAAIEAAGDATGTGLCVGASLDFLAGAQRRAPMYLQQMRLEWLFRLVTKGLFRRYLVDSPAVIGLLLRQRLGSSRPPRG